MDLKKISVKEVLLAVQQLACFDLPLSVTLLVTLLQLRQSYALQWFVSTCIGLSNAGDSLSNIQS